MQYFSQLFKEQTSKQTDTINPSVHRLQTACGVYYVVQIAVELN